jgi:PhnB protein
LTFYGDVFGCSVQIHTYDAFNRADGPAEAVAHGSRTDGPVRLFASDVAGGGPAFRCEGMMFSLLGTVDSATLRDWFSKLSQGGRVVEDMQLRPWGAADGQVIDRYGLHWLIGFEEATLAERAAPAPGPSGHSHGGNVSRPPCVNPSRGVVP